MSQLHAESFVSYCTIVMASALTRADTGICRLAHTLTACGHPYHGLTLSDVFRSQYLSFTCLLWAKDLHLAWGMYLASIIVIFKFAPTMSAPSCLSQPTLNVIKRLPIHATTAPADSMDMSTRRAQESNPDTSGIEPLSHHTKKDPSFNSANISKWLQEHTKRIYV